LTVLDVDVEVYLLAHIQGPVSQPPGLHFNPFLGHHPQVLGQIL
jgi:hypothetical protein